MTGTTATTLPLAADGRETLKTKALKKKVYSKRQVEAALTKQEKIVALLKQGTTIAAIMQATGWQQHSVRGFFAGVVRKKLGFNLTSKKAAAGRVYRIGAVKRSKTPKATVRRA